jgi:hypothetical protein
MADVLSAVRKGDVLQSAAELPGETGESEPMMRRNGIALS